MDLDGFARATGINALVGAVVGGYIGWETGDYTVSQHMSDASSAAKFGVESFAVVKGLAIGVPTGLAAGLGGGYLIDRVQRAYRDWYWKRH